MKATGIVRKVDIAGRLVLPMSLRKALGLENGDGCVEIFVDGESIILRRYSPSCVFCGNMDDLIDYKGARICPACAAHLGELAADSTQQA